MIKQGARKALKATGTLLCSNVNMDSWDEVGDFVNYFVAGDVLMVTGQKKHNCVEIVVFATGRKTSLWRDWLVKNTSLAFDARVLSQPVDG